jgi:lysozyme
VNPRNKIFVGVVSAALLGGAALWEGVSYKPYKDIVGINTVCYGETENVQNRTYSPTECKAMLSARLQEFGNGVNNCITQPMRQNEYDAFTLMAYNIGVKAFCSSSTVRYFNVGKKVQACNAIAFTPDGKPNWSFAGGKFVQGLHNRRLYERSMCLGDTSGPTI